MGMIIPDNETDIDLLYYEAIAGTIVKLLETEGKEPLTVGVHGDWGAGKSSVLMMLERAFEDDDKTLCLRFNGWLFQGFEDTKTVLIETIIEQLLEKRTLSGKAKDTAEKLLKRVDWMKVAHKMGGLAFTAATGLPSIGQAKDVVGIAKGLLDKSKDLTADDIQGFVSEASGILKDVEPESIPTQIHAFRSEFIELLQEAKVDRLVVVVDDLDRCLPETAIETLEAIRLFLFVPGAAFVIAADEAMIEYAVKKHFPDLPLTSGPTSYARNYLEKLIQVPFRLPPLGYVETRTYITLLIGGQRIDRSDARFSKLVDLTKEVLRRPWGGNGFTRDSIAKALGNVPEEIERALQVSDQIAPLLTDGARGNPRQIKRFLNTMTLRLAIAEQRGIASDISMVALAKLMLAERFETSLFSRIEREAAESGKSVSIEALENFVRVDKADMGEDAKQGARGSTPKLQAKPAPDVDEDELRSNEWARRWAKLEPRLSELDLRPYLYISRDRKAVFSSASTLSLMEEWVDKLCGSRLGAKAAAEEIAKLPSGDAEQVFNAVVTRIRSTTDLSQKPPGVDGLVELCKVQKSLQRPTVSLLSSLPVEKLGAWVVSGWGDAFSQPEARSEFDALLEKWAEQDGNRGLKTAASLPKKKKG